MGRKKYKHPRHYPWNREESYHASDVAEIPQPEGTLIVPKTIGKQNNTNRTHFLFDAAFVGKYGGRTFSILNDTFGVPVLTFNEELLEEVSERRKCKLRKKTISRGLFQHAIMEKKRLAVNVRYGLFKLTDDTFEMIPVYDHSMAEYSGEYYHVEHIVSLPDNDFRQVEVPVFNIKLKKQ